MWILFLDEQALIELWTFEVKTSALQLKNYLKNRKECKKNPQSRVAKVGYQLLYREIKDKLKAVESRYQAKLDDLERDHYREHKSLAPANLSLVFTRSIELCLRFLAPLKTMSHKWMKLLTIWHHIVLQTLIW